MGVGESLLLGVDLVKDPARLVAAYDDSAGVTAAVNRNVLTVLNRELGADFDPRAFGHVAVWDAEQEWNELRLRATRSVRVQVPVLDLHVGFGGGAVMSTEPAPKFRRDGREADEAEERVGWEEHWSVGSWAKSMEY